MEEPVVVVAVAGKSWLPFDHRRRQLGNRSDWDLAVRRWPGY